jgi:hypothetical protein
MRFQNGSAILPRRTERVSRIDPGVLHSRLQAMRQVLGRQVIPVLPPRATGR